jgi:hypothetical protein
MKIKVSHLYQLDKVFGKLMTNIQFENFEDAIKLAESQEELQSKLTVPNNLKNKIMTKYTDPKLGKVDDQNLQPLYKELEELYVKEIEVESISPISKSLLKGITITGLEISILIKYDLIEKEKTPNQIETTT